MQSLLVHSESSVKKREIIFGDKFSQEGEFSSREKLSLNLLSFKIAAMHDRRLVQYNIINKIESRAYKIKQLTKYQWT